MSEGTETRQDPAALAWHAEPHKYRLGVPVNAAPRCPHCEATWRGRKHPTRRSTFSCEACGRVVHADPKQGVFPVIYLTGRQALITRTLNEVDRQGVMAGTSADLWWCAQQKEWLRGRPELSVAEAGDALWALLHYNLVHLGSIYPSSTGPAEAQVIWLEELMKRYQAEERALRDAEKAPQTKRAPDTSCPYCACDLAKLKQPSRRGKRKCPGCGKALVVDPTQRLFACPFLSDRQAFLTDTLHQLDHWVFTQGTMVDFEAVARELGVTKPYSEEAVAQVLRALIQSNIARLRQEVDAELASLPPRIRESRSRHAYWNVEAVGELLVRFDSATAK